MLLTDRDIRLVRDIALSHTLSRDQIMALGYFHSVTRTNTRLRELRAIGLVRLLETPFFGQSLYSVGKRARDIVGERIAPLLAARSSSPRFLQHALTVTNARINLLGRGADMWRFEQQLHVKFSFGGRSYEVRPDGLAVRNGELTAVEVDMGHAAAQKLRDKLRGFEAFVASGECTRSWRVRSFTLLCLTTSATRVSNLTRLLPKPCSFDFRCQTLDQFGVKAPGGWS